MKGFSLTQPWASAVALGFKQYETRSWPTRFRGLIALHAAKGYPKWAKEFALTRDELPNELPIGEIIAVCDLVDCRKTTEVLTEIGEVEKLYGDYSESRFAFKLANVKPLRDGIPCKGALGFWTVGGDIERQVWEQLQ